MSAELIKSIFGHNFSSENFAQKFQQKQLTLSDLKLVHEFINSQSYEGINAAYKIGEGDNPIMVMTQLHGNEPAGLAAILYIITLEKAGLLQQPVVAVIGNNLAAEQYFAALDNTAQESRDIYRRGKDINGNPLADMNRVPANFRELDPNSESYIKRWQELDWLTDNVRGIIDIHSARGDMVCITNTSDDKLLKYSPIRNLLTGLMEAIGSATGSAPFKLILEEKQNLDFRIGIEAGTHEDENSFRIAAEFIAALLYNLDLSNIHPSCEENGVFTEYNVGQKISFADLEASKEIPHGEEFTTVKNGKPHQYEEMEMVEKGQILAASQSGIELRAKDNFAVLFVTKSRKLYDDEAIGLYPTKDMSTKFCYPCFAKEVKIDFS